MSFWIAAATFCALVVLSLIGAYIRPRKDAAPAAAYDLQVYRAQLKDIEKDVARGVITETEAERLRIETSRRILDADRALQAATKATQHGGRADQLMIGAALGAVLAGSVAIYLQIGAPGYQDLPLNGRIAMVEEARAERPGQAEAEQQLPFRQGVPPDPEREELVAQLRTAMEQRPNDVEGLSLLAVNEAALGNFRAARLAQGRLIDLLGDAATGANYIDHAEMMVLAAGGYVSPEAEAALTRGLELLPRNGTGRYYAGLMFAQQGRPDLAFPIWRNLLADSAPDAPWVQPIQLQIEEIAYLAGSPVSLSELPQPSPLPGPGPTQEQIDAAADMEPEERVAMIEGMVASLASRLASEGGPPEDWARLIGAFAVLGRTETAAAIYQEARAVFADTPEALAVIEAAGAALQGPSE